jgi:ribosome-associated heat shock protein Hsp15
MTRTFKVLGLLEQRVGAQVAKEFVEDLTPASEFEKKREPNLLPPMYRPKGAGRPTKKDRRAVDSFSDGND